MNKIKNIHFLGVKGVGMAPLAIIANEAGFKVTGCDVDEEFITDVALKKAGIKVFKNFSSEHLENIDLLITTGAHGGFENVEVVEAKKRGIPIWTQGQAVGEFMKGEIFGRSFLGISVAGSHGKTTTTAMIATILKYGSHDPSFVVGTGDIPCLGSPGHFGRGKYFVAEADEYATEPRHDKTPKFLWQHPIISIFTNIEFDHPDVYESIDQMRNDFLTFANQLPGNGALIACGDDSQSKKLIKSYKGKVVTFGFSPNNDFILDRVTVSDGKTFFWVSSRGTSLGEFSINVVGDFNALNALGAIVGALELGLSIDKIKTSISYFTGSKRRFEYVGKLETGAMLFDDYAHHPTEIKKTLHAFAQNFGRSKIVCIFQPHTYSRTKALFEEFAHSFSEADTVILTEIYPSLRETIDSNFSSRLLVDKIAFFNKNAFFLPKLPDVVKYIEQKAYGEDTIIITMGAGDVYKINEKLKMKD